MWLGFHHLIPTPSCCSAVVQQSSLQMWLCQVLRSGQVFTFFVAAEEVWWWWTGGETFALSYSGYKACGIPDEDTIVMTGGYDSRQDNPAHHGVTR